MLESRITELEIKAAYQEDLLQELNKIVAVQQQQIDRLEITCKMLNDRIKTLAFELSDDNPVDETPPHY